MKETKGISKFDKNIQMYFRVAVMSIVIAFLVSIKILPVESDEYFEVNLDKKYDTEITEDDVLYKGSFEIVKSNGNSESISLPFKVNAKVGEKVWIRSQIPDDYREDYLIMRSSQENITIFIDGVARVIYNTKDSRPVGSQTTSRYIFCRTSSMDAGKVLTIAISSDSSKYAGTVNSVYAADRFMFWKYVLNTGGKSIVLGIIILAIGLFITVAGISLNYIFRINTGLENVGWCIVLAGAWLVCESRIRQLISPNASALSNICFLIVMIAPIPLALYLDMLQKKRFERVYQTIIYLSIINLIVQSVFQVFNIHNFLDMLFVSHIVLMATLVCGVIAVLIDARNGKAKEYRTMCIGLILLMVAAASEVVSVYFVTMMSGVFLIIGVASFSIFAIADTVRRYWEHEKHLREEKLREQKRQFDAVTMQMIQTLSDTIETKDEYTNGHSRRVADYSILIGKELGLSEEELSKLHYAASLHDIGKIGVPDTILNKPGKLTDEEYSIIKTHTTIGADIIKGAELISYTEDVIRYHHERFDGKGYPEGISGTDIPLLARIVSVADSYDAMNTKRIYRDSLKYDAIRNEILSNRGFQFDPDVADVMIRLMDSGDLDIQEENIDTAEGVFDLDAENLAEAGQMLSAVMNSIKSSAQGESFDFLTGLMLRNKGENAIGARMKVSSGALIFFDIDNLKTINDLYGHKVGDIALKSLGTILKDNEEKIISCRVGGDEFISFYENANDEDVKILVQEIMDKYRMIQDGDSMLSRTSLSVGVHMSSQGDDFDDSKSKADKALYFVKKTGKNGMSFYKDIKDKDVNSTNRIDLNNLIEAIKTSGNYSGSLDIEYREFTKLYEYINKVCRRYGHTCHLVLVTLENKDKDNTIIDEFEHAMECMGIAIKENIRTVDICTRYSSMQYMVILFEAGEQNIDLVMQRVFSRYYKICENTCCVPFYQSTRMDADDDTE